MTRVIPVLLLFCMIAFADGMLAQSPKPGSTFKPNPNLNEQQKRGEYIFLQRCALCHVMKYGREVSTPRQPPVWWNLQGIFKDAEPDQEQTVRDFILKGTTRMPGWQYTLQPKQIDDVIAYLKTL